MKKVLGYKTYFEIFVYFDLINVNDWLTSKYSNPKSDTANTSNKFAVLWLSILVLENTIIFRTLVQVPTAMIGKKQ